jgi:hypothetical protein
MGPRGLRVRLATFAEFAEWPIPHRAAASTAQRLHTRDMVDCHSGKVAYYIDSHSFPIFLCEANSKKPEHVLVHCGATQFSR